MYGVVTQLRRTRNYSSLCRLLIVANYKDNLLGKILKKQ